MIGCVSWRPSGDILASVQDLNNKLSVVFFEKNGLRHYDFGIRDDVQVTSLDWSPSSEVLSILVQYNSEQVCGLCDIVANNLKGRRRKC